ncbi:MAG: hypothetical protein A3E31_01060 [Candidatus Rokubacteria bacterium RIFCSPHIGHO2_12_FULL_73_22]|nr:MAG: hypothetical protein A3D33_17070 [Candidatus Rokubacteria bacterium RIFCSPHIGHO2_02_FULL_73_26]OGK99422.1 MAG: hypothetical protein A3E31_01060 [Candidatus Rokubacteria bacterium RIFCSPHIGHO2_12_FULL_73_22]
MEATMGRSGTLTRKSFFVNERALRRAKKLLGVTTDAEVVRASVDLISEMEEFWQFMKKTRGTLKPGSIKAP